MSSKTSTSTTVIREVAPGVWIFSRPFARSGWFPFGGRSTAVRLADGGVWVIASTPLDAETKTTIDALGPVRFIVSPDAEHHFFLAEYKKAYPDAALLGVEDVVAKSTDLKFAGVWGRDPAGTKYGFEDEIQHVYFSGFQNKDVAFFHAPSKTLIEADLLFNLPGNEQYSKSGKSGKLFITNLLQPYSWAHKKFLSGASTDKEAMSRDAKIVAGWDFERVIPCHGDVIEKDGKKAWTAAYADFLK